MVEGQITSVGGGPARAQPGTGSSPSPVRDCSDSLESKDAHGIAVYDRNVLMLIVGSPQVIPSSLHSQQNSLISVSQDRESSVRPPRELLRPSDTLTR